MNAYVGRLVADKERAELTLKEIRRQAYKAIGLSSYLTGTHVLDILGETRENYERPPIKCPRSTGPRRQDGGER